MCENLLQQQPLSALQVTLDELYLSSLVTQNSCDKIERSSESGLALTVLVRRQVVRELSNVPVVFVPELCALHMLTLCHLMKRTNSLVKHDYFTHSLFGILLIYYVGNIPFHHIHDHKEKIQCSKGCEYKLFISSKNKI